MQPLGFLCFTVETGWWKLDGWVWSSDQGPRAAPLGLGGALDGGSSFYMSILRKPNGALSN